MAKTKFITVESDRFKELYAKSDKPSYQNLVNKQVDYEIEKRLNRLDPYLFKHLNSETKKTKTSFLRNRSGEWVRTFTTNTPNKIVSDIITLPQMEFGEKLDMLGTLEFLIAHESSFRPV